MLRYRIHPLIFFRNLTLSTSGEFLPNRIVQQLMSHHFRYMYRAPEDRLFGISSNIFVNSSKFKMVLSGQYDNEDYHRASFELSIISTGELCFRCEYELLTDSGAAENGIFRVWPINRFRDEYLADAIERLKLISGIQNENIIKSIFLEDNFWEINLNGNECFYLKSLQYHQSVVVLKVINNELHIDFLYDRNLNENTTNL